MEKIILTKDQAINLLDEGEYIHTFMQGGMSLIGCDHSRESILEDIQTADVLEIGGDTCVSMGHGLVIDGRLFVKANREKVNNLITQNQ